MTHEELLAKIDALETFDERLEMTEAFRAVKALRAVVELHKPDFVGKCMSPICEIITPQGNDYAKWPCETIQAIEKELM